MAEPQPSTETVVELGKMVKDKFPGKYDKMIDAEVGRLVKDKFPGKYDKFIDPKNMTAFQRKNLAAVRSSGVESTKATYDSDIASAKSEAAGTLSNIIPVAATLGTGAVASSGLKGAAALGAKVGIQAGAGGFQGAVEELAKLTFGAPDAATSGKELVKRVAIDAGLGGALEGGFELLKYGGASVLKPMLARSAAKVEAGTKVLGDFGVAQLNKLRAVTSSAGARGATTVAYELKDLDASLALRRTGITDAMKAEMGILANKISKAGGDLAALAEVKGDVSQAAFKREGLHFEERRALKEFAAKLDKRLASGFKDLGVGDVYKTYKDTADQLYRYSTGMDFAQRAFRLATNQFTLSGAGGAYGAYSGYRTGGMKGAVAHGLEGAAMGAGLSMLEKRVAPFVLEVVLSDKAASPLAKRALGMVVSDPKKAFGTFMRAVNQSGVKEVIKPAIKEMMAEEQLAPPNAPAPAQ